MLVFNIFLREFIDLHLDKTNTKSINKASLNLEQILIIKELFESNKHLEIFKLRQSGVSTLLLAYALYLMNLGEKVLFVCHNSNIMNDFKNKCEDFCNLRELRDPLSGGYLKFICATDINHLINQTRGFSFDYFIFDECSIQYDKLMKFYPMSERLRIIATYSFDKTLKIENSKTIDLT